MNSFSLSRVEWQLVPVPVISSATSVINIFPDLLGLLSGFFTLVMDVPPQILHIFIYLLSM